MRNGLLLALLLIVAMAAFYVGTQTREPAGPGERFGKALDESAREVERGLKKLADDLEE